jgi:hypothetical protein
MKSSSNHDRDGRCPFFFVKTNFDEHNINGKYEELAKCLRQRKDDNRNCQKETSICTVNYPDQDCTTNVVCIFYSDENYVRESVMITMKM